MTSGAFEIWVCDQEGRNPLKVTSFESASGAGTPRWSPNGERIAFDCRAEGNGHIYVVTLKTGQVRRLTKGASENVVPSWSKDGRSVYFSSNRTGQHHVWKMPTDGGEAVQVTRSGGFAPIESPDGQWVYYRKGQNRAGALAGTCRWRRGNVDR